VPTLAESGLPGYQAGSWYGLAAPKGTPRAIVDKLNGEVSRILADPGVRDRILTPNFIYPITRSPEAFAERIRADFEKWGQVVGDAKVKAE
jgi:tripartite-type tricarboxylate transporter receptor subunit TctC